MPFRRLLKVLVTILQDYPETTGGIIGDLIAIGYQEKAKHVGQGCAGDEQMSRISTDTSFRESQAIASPVRQARRTQCHTLWYQARRRKGWRVFALGQRVRHCAEHVATTAGTVHGERVRRWFQDKKAGWYAVLADPQMPATRTLLDQAHNAMERKRFAMQGFPHPGGSQQVFLTGFAHLYNLVPYQRRAQHAGQCGMEVEGGRVPTRDGFLHVQILTSGGCR